MPPRPASPRKSGVPGASVGPDQILPAGLHLVGMVKQYRVLDVNGALDMNLLALAFMTTYAAVLAVICMYGLHRYWVVWAFLRQRRRAGEPQPSPATGRLPRVTVQLPMFNERYVAERVIEAACGIDYPPDRLEVQVLDDSTDESAGIARRCCERLADAGMVGLIAVGDGRRQQPQRQIFSVLADFTPNQKVSVIVLQPGTAFLGGDDQPFRQVLNGIR